MRLQLATGGASVPIAVGNPAVNAPGGFAGVRLGVDRQSPATASGTLTTVNVYGHQAGTIYAMTGTVSGTNYTVRAISSALTIAVGSNTFAVSLAIAAGDFMAYYAPSSGGGGVKADSAVGSAGFASSPSATPSPGAVLPFSNTTSLLSLGGTG